MGVDEVLVLFKLKTTRPHKDLGGGHHPPDDGGLHSIWCKGLLTRQDQIRAQTNPPKTVAQDWEPCVCWTKNGRVPLEAWAQTLPELQVKIWNLFPEHNVRAAHAWSSTIMPSNGKCPQERVDVILR